MTAISGNKKSIENVVTSLKDLWAKARSTEE